MTPEELLATFKTPAGYLGPIGLEAAPHPKKPGTLVILDKALEGRTNLIAGANKEEYHLRNVTPMRDFKPTLIADVRNINEGELDPIGQQPLRLGKAVEIGHIFKLGYKYTKSMGASVLNRDGKVTPLWAASASASSTPALPSRSSRRSQQRRSLRPVAYDRTLPGSRHHYQHQGRVSPLRRRKDRSRPHRRRPRHASSTTATNAPASNSTTPN